MVSAVDSPNAEVAGPTQGTENLATATAETAAADPTAVSKVSKISHHAKLKPATDRSAVTGVAPTNCQNISKATELPLLAEELKLPWPKTLKFPPAAIVPQRDRRVRIILDSSSKVFNDDVLKELRALAEQIREDFPNATIADMAAVGGIKVNALVIGNRRKCTQYNALGWCTVGCKYKHTALESGGERVNKVLLRLKRCYEAMKSNKRAKMSA